MSQPLYDIGALGIAVGTPKMGTGLQFILGFCFNEQLEEYRCDGIASNSMIRLAASMTVS